MPILLVEQTFSPVGPVKRLCFLKYALKGTGNVLLVGSSFFLVSTRLKGRVQRASGSIFPVCFRGPWFPRSLSKGL